MCGQRAKKKRTMASCKRAPPAPPSSAPATHTRLTSRHSKSVCTYSTGTQHLELRQQVKRITTGCRDLDKILGGGIESQSITEIYGEFRTGKTQWVHTLVVTGMVGPPSHSTHPLPLHIRAHARLLPPYSLALTASQRFWRRRGQGHCHRHRGHFSQW